MAKIAVGDFVALMDGDGIVFRTGWVREIETSEANGKGFVLRYKIHNGSAGLRPTWFAANFIVPFERVMEVAEFYKRQQIELRDFQMTQAADLEALRSQWQ